MRSLAVGAIFKNELEYLPEWFAWHIDAGVEHFYIADNGSTDGTVEYLEALQQAGTITLFYQPQKKNAQLDAYNYILKLAERDNNYLLLIDADEFVFSDNIKPAVLLRKMIESDENIGAIALNWRVFGSSGNSKAESDFVTRRFHKHAAINNEKNKYIKSVMKPEAVAEIRVHCAQLKPGFKYINSISKTASFVNPKHIPLSKPSGKTTEVLFSPLCIHHYAVKSKEEYILKKKNRGDAIVGPDHDRGMAYFKAHDINEECFDRNKIDYFSLGKTIKELEKKIKESTYYQLNLHGSLARLDHKGAAGWIKVKGREDKVKLMIYVNGEFYDSFYADGYREDLKLKFQTSGCHSFNYNFSTPLNDGDKLVLKVIGNDFKFEGNEISINKKTL